MDSRLPFGDMSVAPTLGVSSGGNIVFEPGAIIIQGDVTAEGIDSIARRLASKLKDELRGAGKW